MTKNSMKFLKGMGLGLLAGCAVGAMGYGYVKQHKRGFKKNMGKALRNMSDLVDSVNGMF